MKRIVFLAGLALAASFAPAAMSADAARAANPLDAKSCEQLGVEREALIQLGVEKDMQKGPDWAKANLSQSDLNLIRLFIEISERLKFRCASAASALAAAKLSITQPDPVAAPAPPLPKPVLVPPLPVRRSAFIRPERSAPPSVVGAKPAAAKPKPPAKKKDGGG